MIVLRTPKGWTGPKRVDGKQVEGTWRSHQVPLAGRAREPRASARCSRSGCAATGRRSSSTSTGRLVAELDRAGAARRAAHERQPARQRRPRCCATCACPTSATTRSTCRRPATTHERGHPGARRIPARRDRAQPGDRFGCSAPTRRRPTASARSSRSTARAWDAELVRRDDDLAPDGRVMEVLSEHQCQGWLEGYLLTGRHGLFNCYEAFIHIIDSMFNQHAKWLKVTREIPWRLPDRLAQLPAQLPRLAPGPQRLLAPGPGLHRSRREQEGRGHPRLPAAGRQHACSRSPTTACAAATTST